MIATALMYLLLTCCRRSVMVTEATALSSAPSTHYPTLPPHMFVCRMSVQADDARAKVIHCETLDNEQKARMLLLINTQPDTILLVCLISSLDILFRCIWRG